MIHNGKRSGLRLAAFISVAAITAWGGSGALAQETPPAAAEPSLFAAGWWVLLAVAVACVAFGGWVWWSYRRRK